MNKPILTRVLPRWLLISFLLLSLVGLLDASYLTQKYYSDLSLGCFNFSDCDKVTTSQYATIGNVPVALLGSVYYLVIFVLILVNFGAPHYSKKIINILSRLTAVGFLASLWFVYLQLFVIQGVCIYCMISAVTSTALFALGLAAIKFSRSTRYSTELN